mmetsp:Transcript_23952/g.77090  ORF Transcript_23952/g.77090 Transcript_23952/m.77090 type:complete len:290 (-) Transcript_23952:219-1088(-)
MDGDGRPRARRRDGISDAQRPDERLSARRPRRKEGREQGRGADAGGRPAQVHAGGADAAGGGDTRRRRRRRAPQGRPRRLRDAGVRRHRERRRGLRRRRRRRPPPSPGPPGVGRRPPLHRRGRRRLLLEQRRRRTRTRLGRPRRPRRRGQRSQSHRVIPHLRPPPASLARVGHGRQATRRPRRTQTQRHRNSRPRRHHLRRGRQGTPPAPRTPLEGLLQGPRPTSAAPHAPHLGSHTQPQTPLVRHSQIEARLREGLLQHHVGLRLSPSVSPQILMCLLPVQAPSHYVA